MLRRDVYTGGEHYWIMYYHGGYAVMMEMPECYDENRVVFHSGSYSACVRKLDEIVANNYEYDMNL